MEYTKQPSSFLLWFIADGADVGCPAEIGTDADDSQVSELVHWFEGTLGCWVLVDLVDKWKFTKSVCLWGYMTHVLKLVLVELHIFPWRRDHSVTVSRSAWKIAISASQDIALEILVSSAKHLIVECVIQPVISLMKMRNKTGPRTVPWGTPLIIIAARESCPPKTTCWLRSVRKDLIHRMSCGCTPYFSSFLRRRAWSTLSKALLKSKYMQSVSRPLWNWRWSRRCGQGVVWGKSYQLETRAASYTWGCLR